MATTRARGRWMARYARWHIWLGWLVGVPRLLWTLCGLAMIARPIEEVRGDHLRVASPPERLPAGFAIMPAPVAGGTTPVELRTFVQRGRPVTLATAAGGEVTRYDARTGAALPPVDAAEARRIVAAGIRGGRNVTALEAFAADAPPLGLRKAIATWRATLADGTHVYIDRATGEIAAVRTRWWRIYDFFWGLHIMDLETREDAHNPFTLAFGGLALAATLLGFVLLFRRRKGRARA
ncbi:MAG: PepSY domain-containing protein [Cypionkella sp.]